MMHALGASYVLTWADVSAQEQLCVCNQRQGWITPVGALSVKEQSAKP